MGEERWAVCPKTNGRYEVSDRGNVRSLVGGGRRRKTPLPFKAHKTKDGHLKVTIIRNERRETINVHRLVLEAFVGPCPPGLVCCHNDGVHDHNELSNLRWDTESSNQQDRLRHGYVPLAGEAIGMSKLTLDDIRCIRAEPKRHGVGAMLARAFGVCQSNISAIRSGHTWASFASLEGH